MTGSSALSVMRLRLSVIQSARAIPPLNSLVGLLLVGS